MVGDAMCGEHMAMRQPRAHKYRRGAPLKGMEVDLLCLMSSGVVPGRLTPTTLAALLRYERHSQLTDDIFLYKRELTKVGKGVRAHPSSCTNDEGVKLRRFICNLNKRIVNLQK
jgi:hypothetical protein